MNEQIRELIVRLVPDAFMTYKGYLYHSSDPKVLEHSDPEPLYTRQELEKFARLIVRECAEVVEGFVLTEEVSLDEYVDYEASDVLKKHFGVEE